MLILGVALGLILGAIVMSAALDTAIANLNAAADALIAKAAQPVDDSAAVAAVDAVTQKLNDAASA